MLIFLVVFGGGSHHIPSPTRPAISFFQSLQTNQNPKKKKKKKNPKGSDEFFDIKLNRYLYKYQILLKKLIKFNRGNRYLYKYYILLKN